MDIEKTIETAVANAIKSTKGFQLPKVTNDIIDIDGASDLTGYRKNTIYKLVCQRQIPFIKRPGGRKLFFSRKALESWILGKK